MKRSEFLNKTKEELEIMLTNLRDMDNGDDDFRVLIIYTEQLLHDDEELKLMTETADDRKLILATIENVKIIKELYDKYGYAIGEDAILKAYNDSKQIAEEKSALLEEDFEDDIGEITEEEAEETADDVIIKSLGIMEGFTQAQKERMKDYLVETPELIEEGKSETDKLLDEIQDMINKL